MAFAEELNVGGFRGSVRNLASGPVDDLTMNVYGGLGGHGLSMDMDANPLIYSAEALESHLQRYLYLLDSLAEAMKERPYPVRLLLGAGELERSHVTGNSISASELAKRLAVLSEYGMYAEFKEFEGEGHLSVLPVLISKALRFALHPEHEGDDHQWKAQVLEGK